MVDSQALRALLDAARAPLAEWPTRYPGYHGIGYLCNYAPLEILHAAGFSPIRLRGSSRPLRRVDSHLQSFSCALCRSTLDQFLVDEQSFLAGTIFAHTCDAMQALADLWRRNAQATHFVDTVMLPAHLGSAAARPYLISELVRFRERLASFSGGRISDDTLKESIALYDETRRLVEVLQSWRDRVDSPSLYAILDAAQIVPPQQLNPLLANLLSDLEGMPPRRGGRALFLCGAVLDEPRWLDIVEELGARVAGDDLCSGSRHFHGRVGTDQDPIPALADYYFRRPPCPSKFLPSHLPARYLLDRFHETQADGIVFVLEKFCEPHAFDYALVRAELEQRGVPSLLLEMEQTPSMEALRTRLQAFVEIL